MPQGRGGDRSRSPAIRCRARSSTSGSRPTSASSGLVGEFEVPLGLFLQAAPPRDVIARMLRNLKEIHRGAEDWQRLLAVQDRLVILLPDAWEERRDRGLAHAELGQRDARGRRPGGLPEHAPSADDAPRSPSGSPSCAAAAGRGCTELRAQPRRPHLEWRPHRRPGARTPAGRRRRHDTAAPAQRRTLDLDCAERSPRCCCCGCSAPVLTPFVVGAVLAYALHPAVERAGARAACRASRGGRSSRSLAIVRAAGACCC